MSAKIGYARVSTREQNLDGQLDMLNQAGCERIYSNKTSGVTEQRPGWDSLLAYVRPGDTIVVAELSRMTRSLSHLLQLAQVLESKKINLAKM